MPITSPAVSILAVPYHLGREAVRVGAGPDNFLAGGVVAGLAEHDMCAEVERIAGIDSALGELDAVVAVDAALAGAVARAIDAGRFPLVLAGDCNSCLGILAALAPHPVGVVWLDAHGDLNTPETSASGFLDGMCMAIASGRCHEDARARIGLAEPFPETRHLLVDVRDLDDGERHYLRTSPVRVVASSSLHAEGVRAALAPALEGLRARTRDVYLHIDLDVLDPETAPGVSHPTPIGLSEQELLETLRTVGDTFRIAAAAITNHLPSADVANRTRGLGIRIAIEIVKLALR
jgi:arginase